MEDFGGAQFSAFKNALVDLAVAKLGPIGAEMRRLESDPSYIDSVLRDGSQRARVPVLLAAFDALGLEVPPASAVADVTVLGGGRPVGAVEAVDAYQPIAPSP